MYKLIDSKEAIRLLCIATKKWGVILSFGSESWSEVKKAAPYLADDNILLLYGDFSVALCDTEEEAYDIYEQTVGDDGPTQKNPYNGPARVYALTCSPEGEWGAENT